MEQPESSQSSQPLDPSQLSKLSQPSASPESPEPIEPLFLPFPREDLAQVRLVATDMDGTLTQGERFLPALLETLMALAAADIAVVIVTGRSAGWVQGLVHYLPVVGAIAENGGLYLPAGGEQREWLVPITPVTAHRQRLSTLFEQIQTRYPHLHPSSDNDFRLTDWTFDVAGLDTADLRAIAALCDEAGWGFTYSTVQCHLRLRHQDKGAGLTHVMAQHFPGLSPTQVVTVGDSPNDAELFDPSRFPRSVGVANVAAYRDRLPHPPSVLTPAPEFAGFQQVAAAILAAQGHPLPKKRPPSDGTEAGEVV